MGNQVASTKKETDSGSCEYATWGSSCMQGWRSEMEDVHLSLARLFEPCNCPPPFQHPQTRRAAQLPPRTLQKKPGTADGSLFCQSAVSFFGVFDGHGGSIIPAYVGATLPSELSRELSRKCRAAFVEEKRQEASSNAKTRIPLRQKKVSAAAAAAVREDVEIPQFVSRALRNAYVETDWKAIDDIPNDATTSGTTTITALIVAAERPKVVTTKQNFAPDGTLLPADTPVKPPDAATARLQPIFGNTKREAWGLLWVANSGDSRAVLCRGGWAVPMSDDHKPWVEGEIARIEASGHEITNGRVDGGINLTRGLGDWRYKTKATKPELWAVTCVPDVRRKTLAQDDEFLVMGCDGIWDRMSSQQMCNFIRLRLMPRSHWSEGELSVDQGINPKFYDPYTEYERAVRERTKERKLQKEEMAKKRAEAKAEAKSHPEEGDDVIHADNPTPTIDDSKDEESLDDLSKHHKDLMDRLCEPKEVFDRYKLWPGDPGVCSSVEELLTTIARHVCNNCLSSGSDATVYGTDNMTVTIILFPNSQLGRAVHKRYQKREKTSSRPDSPATHHRVESTSAACEPDSVDRTVMPRTHSDPPEFSGSSSGSPGTAGVMPSKVSPLVTASKPLSDADSPTPSPPISDSSKKTKSKHKKHKKQHRPKVDLTAPMTDAEKMVYQFADSFSDDDIYVIPPERPAFPK